MQNNGYISVSNNTLETDTSKKLAKNKTITQNNYPAFVSKYTHNQCQFNSVTQSCLTLCDPMDCSTPGFPVHHQLREFAQTHGHRVGDAIHPSHPLSSPSPPAFNLSQHQGLESVLHIRWPKYWSFSFSISSSNEYSELISFRMDWLDLLAVQGTLKSLLPAPQFKSIILQH